MNDILMFGTNVPPVVYIPALYLLWVAGFLLLKKLFYRKIQDLAKFTTSDIDDIFLDALNKPYE